MTDANTPANTRVGAPEDQGVAVDDSGWLVDPSDPAGNPRRIRDGRDEDPNY
jgi:hypothetical protein